MSATREKREGAGKQAVKAWMLRHELLASCILTTMLGLAIGGVTTILERLLV